MIGLVSSSIGKGGRIMVPGSSRAYKGGRFLGQHGGFLKTSRGGRVLGSKLPRIVRTKITSTQPKGILKSKKRPIRHTKRPIRRKKRPSKSLRQTLTSTLAQSARSALQGVVRQGKRSLKSSAKTLAQEAPKILAKQTSHLLHKTLSRKRAADSDEERPVKHRRFEKHASVKKGYLAGTKQYGGLRLF